MVVANFLLGGCFGVALLTSLTLASEGKYWSSLGLAVATALCIALAIWINTP